MKKHLKRKLLLLFLAGVAAVLSGCAATDLVRAEDYDPEIHARIRILFPLPNIAFLYPGKNCYSEDGPSFFSAGKKDPDSIIAHSGGKNFGMVNSLSLFTSNRKVGIPSTEDITWNHHEYIVPAGQPLTVESSITSMSDPGYTVPSVSCRAAVTFIPQAATDYDSVFIMYGSVLRASSISCEIQIREIPPDGTDPVVIETEKAYPCEKS